MVGESPEYPDLRFVEPRWWKKAGRTFVQFVVIHATDDREGATAAEAGAHYDTVRSNEVSTHFFHDADSTIQCVRTEDIAFAAYPQGNARGIQHELCGYANQSAGQWVDAVSKATLAQAARQVARDCAKWGIPVRKLTPAQAAAGVKGILGHHDVTLGFPQDHGNHTDPGPSFPWDTFLALVQAEMEDDMTPDQMLNLLASPAGQALLSRAAGVGVHGQLLGRSDVTIGQAIDSTRRVVATLAQTSGVDEQAIVTGILTALNPQQIALAVVAALPADEAKKVVDELTARLAA